MIAALRWSPGQHGRRLSAPSDLQQGRRLKGRGEFARSYRTVTEMDQLRAERIDHVAAEQAMNLRGKDTLMTAERLVKVDGEQIHMG
jgi:Protein of unknown function (DUF3540)